MKKIVMIIVTMFLSVFMLNAQDAASIMRSAKERIKFESISVRARMVVTAKNGATAERVIDHYSKNGAKDSRIMIAFLRPANVANTRFLSIDNVSGASERWLFLPSAGKSRRLTAAENSGSFEGTDFSYDDLSSLERNVQLDKHTMLSEENLNGTPCYVIQSVPLDSAYQYSKTVTWIDKKNPLIYKREMYDRRGNLAKILELSDFKTKQDRLTPLQTKMTTVAAGTHTTVYVDVIKYDGPMPEGIFSTAYLETGKVR